MTSELIIRKAKGEDAARIAELSGTLGYPVTAEAMAERLGRMLPMETHTVFVAEISGNIVGWTHGAEQELLEMGFRCEILGLVVAEGQRGLGTGRRLVEAIEQWARARGLAQIFVRSNVIRPESHPFYERIGYERYKTQHAYRKQL
jgi:N-acetylglutamate synthase-like GNAT family acetyltransferase